MQPHQETPAVPHPSKPALLLQLLLLPKTTVLAAIIITAKKALCTATAAAAAAAARVTVNRAVGVSREVQGLRMWLLLLHKRLGGMACHHLGLGM
jgi:hypothetical protein